MMPIKMYALPFLIAVLILLPLACAPTQPTVNSPGTDLPDTPETHPAGTQLPTVAVDTIETLVAAPEYLRGCRELNPPIHDTQAVYKDIVPGKTTSREVKNLIGDPIQIIVNVWRYDGYGIEFENDTVSQISVSGYLDPLPTIRGIVETYGCPDVIFAYHLSSDEPSLETPGTLDMVSFIYCSIGVKFEIFHYPVRLSDRVEAAYYYVPKSLHDYIYNVSFREGILEASDSIKVVSWDEAVKE